MPSKFEVIETFTKQHREKILYLYHHSWWSKDRTMANVETILENSSLCIGLIDKSTKALCCFARVLTDYFKHAHIYDVMVDPKLRNAGLGKEIMQIILDHPSLQSIIYFELNCLPDMVSFYEKFGFSDKIIAQGKELIRLRRIRQT